MDGAVWLVALISILLGLSSSASADGLTDACGNPAGDYDVDVLLVCFWSGECTNRWSRTGCGIGRVKVDHSEDCHGLCPPPRYPICHPFASHLLCCNEETPTPSDECARCANRVEVGDHWMCCSDGTQAKVINHELKTGFCRSGAQLSIQPKQREVFKWRPREWSACSASCGEGVRHRAVHCVGMLKHSPMQLYYVNETKCDPARMPHQEEPCGAKACQYGSNLHYKDREYHRRKHRFPWWAKLIIFSLTSVGTAGISVGGYILYQRWKERNSNHGFVYVMLDNYS